MKTRVLLASSALLVLTVASAAAGPCTDQINDLTKTLSSKDAGSGTTPGAGSGTTTASGQKAEHPPTSRIGKVVEGTATSPEDARRQTQGKPTVAEQGGNVRQGGSNDPEAAKAALDRARGFDATGDESQCMASVREARTHLSGQ